MGNNRKAKLLSKTNVSEAEIIQIAVTQGKTEKQAKYAQAILKKLRYSPAESCLIFENAKII